MGGGNNAVILHYIANDQPLRDGDVVCVDAGCELGSYTGDVTRAWPVNGKFTEGQREIYEAVLAANEAAIAVCKPGIRYREIQKPQFNRYGIHGSLGLLEGEVENLPTKGTSSSCTVPVTGWGWMYRCWAYVDGTDSIIVESGMILTISRYL